MERTTRDTWYDELAARPDLTSDGGLPTSRPPEGAEVVRTWVLDASEHLTTLRGELRQELAHGLEPQPELNRVAHAMVLVASELATNALRHGIPPTVVRLLRLGPTLLLDVADHDLSTEPYVAQDRAPGHGGFGLQIARRLAVDVGWYASDTTKHVWAQFAGAEDDRTT